MVPRNFVIFIPHLDPSRCRYDLLSPKVSLSLSTYKIKFQNSQIFIIIIIIIIIIIVVIIIIIIIKFLISQLWLCNIHLSCDVVMNKIRLSGLICSLKSFLQLIFAKNYRFLQLYIYTYIYIYIFIRVQVESC